MYTTECPANPDDRQEELAVGGSRRGTGKAVKWLCAVAIPVALVAGAITVGVHSEATGPTQPPPANLGVGAPACAPPVVADVDGHKYHASWRTTPYRRVKVGQVMTIDPGKAKVTSVEVVVGDPFTAADTTSLARGSSHVVARAEATLKNDKTNGLVSATTDLTVDSSTAGDLQVFVLITYTPTDDCGSPGDVGVVADPVGEVQVD